MFSNEVILFVKGKGESETEREREGVKKKKASLRDSNDSGTKWSNTESISVEEMCSHWDPKRPPEMFTFLMP